jgi:hypothetical protein
MLILILLQNKYNFSKSSISHEEHPMISSMKQPAKRQKKTSLTKLNSLPTKAKILKYSLYK